MARQNGKVNKSGGGGSKGPQFKDFNAYQNEQTVRPLNFAFGYHKDEDGNFLDKRGGYIEVDGGYTPDGEYHQKATVYDESGKATNRQPQYMPREYTVVPQLGAALTRMTIKLDADLKEYDLNSNVDRVKVFDRCFDIISKIVGLENWKQLEADGFDVFAAIRFIEWIHNEAASREEAELDEEEEEDDEPDPDDAPGESGEEQGKASRSRRTTSSSSGAR